MFNHDSDEARAHNAIEADEHKHKPHLAHELIAGAAAFEAAKAYQKHKEKNGKPDTHAKAKAIVAGLIGVAVDRIIETKGLDAIDKAKANREAEKKFENPLSSEYSCK